MSRRSADDGPGALPKRVERRRYPRYPCRIRCNLSSGEFDLRGFVADLSASGVFIQTAQRLATGTKVTMTLDTGGESLLLTGFVARSRHVDGSAPAGIGVSLESAPEAYFQMVLDLDTGC